MKAIPQFAVTPAMVTSDVAEPSPGETVWVAASYALGAEVIVIGTLHNKYECILAGASATSPELDPARWKYIGKTNKYALFDSYRNTPTTKSLSMSVEVTPGKRFNAAAVMGAVGEILRLVMTVGATTVWDSGNIDLRLRKTARWYEYFFGPFSFTGSKIFFNLPPYSGAKLTMTISRTAGDVSCGVLAVGNEVYIGKMLSQARSEALNFSTIERDLDGQAVVTPRPTKPATTQTLVADASSIESVRSLRSLGNAVPIIFSGLDDHDSNPYFEALLIQGVYTEFTIGLPNMNRFETSLSVQEL